MFNFDKFLVKYIRFHDLQKHAQNLQYVHDEDFYEFLFQKLIFILLCFSLKYFWVLF
jgi:hypothetical protein